MVMNVCCNVISVIYVCFPYGGNRLIIANDKCYSLEIYLLLPLSVNVHLCFDLIVFVFLKSSADFLREMATQCAREDDTLSLKHPCVISIFLLI